MTKCTFVINLCVFKNILDLEIDKVEEILKIYAFISHCFLIQ